MKKSIDYDARSKKHQLKQSIKLLWLFFYFIYSLFVPCTYSYGLYRRLNFHRHFWSLLTGSSTFVLTVVIYLQEFEHSVKNSAGVVDFVYWRFDLCTYCCIYAEGSTSVVVVVFYLQAIRLPYLLLQFICRKFSACSCTLFAGS